MLRSCPTSCLHHGIDDLADHGFQVEQVGNLIESEHAAQHQTDPSLDQTANIFFLLHIASFFNSFFLFNEQSLLMFNTSAFVYLFSFCVAFKIAGIETR